MHDVKSIDVELRSIADQRQHLLAREAALLIHAEDLQVWKLHGCASLLDYLERICDLHPRTAKEKLRVARALEHLPVMAAAFDTGRIVYSTVRELSRIATPETESAWLDEVAGMSPREIALAVHESRGQGANVSVVASKW